MPSARLPELRCGSDFRQTSKAGDGARRTPTIVIPVCDGWPVVATCLQSLLDTIPTDVPVRIVDDASGDARLIAWLDELPRRFPGRLRLIRNAANRGYLQSVNEALDALEGDVVVANSDTRFTPRWLEALAAVAEDPAVGIVNPISDNATILSVPELAQASEAALAELREALWSTWYELPTAVGFCMYIKREALAHRSAFDLLFDPGYGEECDLSLRLRRAGLRIAAAPASIVFHEGSRSFGKRAGSLRERHDKLLSLRWPAYHGEILRFSGNNPVRAVREFLEGAQSTGALRVLHVLHELDYLGGIELFTRELLSRFSPETEHVVLCPGRVNDPWNDLAESRLGPNVRVIRFDPGRHAQAAVAMGIPAGRRHADLDRLFARVLAAGRFNCVHFHTLVRLGTLAWPSICRALEVPYVLSVHEFFHLCHDYNMVLGPGDQRSCGKTICHERDADCLGCLGPRMQRLDEPLSRFIERRRRTWRDILRGAECIYSNGPLVSRSVTEAYGSDLQPAIREFEPYFYRSRPAIAPVAASTDNPLHVAFLGAFSPRKGGDVFLAARRLLVGRPIRWSVIGNLDSRMKPALEGTDVRATGPYQRSQLDELLADVDLVVQASIWPETFSITTSEAWERGRPVVAPAIGAFLDRVRHGENGWLYRPGDARALAERIDRLAGRSGRRTLAEVSGRLCADGRRDNPIARDLEALYSRFPAHCRLADLADPAAGGSHGLALPVPADARATTREWLEQPMCLEAAVDWADPGELVCLASGRQSAAGVDLESSLREHAPAARLLTVEGVGALPDDAPVLLVQDDTLLTANAGNWLAWWRQCGAPFGLCNYLLHDGEGRQYAPVFRGPGDVGFTSRHPRRWAGLIATASRIRALLERTGEEAIFEARLDRLLAPEHLAHYDGCGLSMLDQRWAALWKAEHADGMASGAADDSTAAPPSRIGVIVQGGPGRGTRRVLSGLFAQKGIELQGVAVLLPPGIALPGRASLPGTVRASPWDARDPAASVNRAVRALPPVDVIAFVGDNVLLDNRRLLATMIRDMARCRISAISPVLPPDRRGARVLARRTGCGERGLPGYGPPATTPFDTAGAVLPADFLDDDLFLVDRGAWREVGGMPADGGQFYRAVMLSERLRSAGFRVARSPAFVRKAPLPSSALAADPARYPQEREDVLRILARSRAPSAFSRSMSLDAPHGLEYRKHAFKGGGRAPRVLAYAHDVWASGFYRVRAPVAALAAANRVSSHFLPEQRERRVPNVAEVAQAGASTLLLHSFLHDGQLGQLADYHRLLDIPVVFSLDDWLLELPGYNPFSKTNYPDMARRVRYAMAHCDRLIVPTATLAEYYERFVDDIRVVPNRIPRALVRAPREPRDGALRVGWAGAPQHAGDLDWLAPVVRATGEHCRWVFFGQKPAGLSAEECEFHAAVPLKDYFEKLGQLDLDLAVAPLGDNPFNRAKSPLKLLEYAALGLPVICTDCRAYSGTPALTLANDPGQWIEEVTRLARDSGSRAELAAGLRRWLLDGHVLEDHLDDWGRALSLNA